MFDGKAGGLEPKCKVLAQAVFQKPLGHGRIYYAWMLRFPDLSNILPYFK